MFNAIQRESKADGQLAYLLAEAREYAHIYVLARKRQKGCDGMGELATMKEEFRDVVDRMMRYCKDKEYIALSVSFDVDSIADEIESEREAPWISQ